MHRVTTIFPCALDERAARAQTVILQGVTTLSEGDERPETLHRLRTNFRRLQAYFELADKSKEAGAIAQCVSRLSRLRTLQVFQKYLVRKGAAKADVRIVQALVRDHVAKLKEKHVYRKIRQQVWQYASLTTPTIFDGMAGERQVLRYQQGERFQKVLAATIDKPRRKKLHQLRLLIKSIRYQEEWASDRRSARTEFINRLKHIQDVLGKYEELTEFRKLARDLELDAKGQIIKDWRRARRRARALPAQLGWVPARCALRC